MSKTLYNYQCVLNALTMARIVHRILGIEYPEDYVC